MDFVAATPVLFGSNHSVPNECAPDLASLLHRAARSLSLVCASRLSLHPVASRLAAAVGSPKAKAEPSETDFFFERGEELLRRSRRHTLPLGLLVFELDDLPEFQVVFGQSLAAAVLAETTASLRCVATSSGQVAWTTPTTLTVVAPGVTGEQLAIDLEATLGVGCCIEFETDDAEVILVPEFRVLTLGATESLKQAYATACRDITKARIATQRRDHYLTRERESHSQPAPLKAAVTMGSAPPKLPDHFRAYAPVPATIPVPFGSHA